jgi:uncharacterized tellurite resistance protein B-like protein
MEEEIGGFMSLMEPEYLHDDSALGQDMRSFLVLSAYAVASTDGNVDPAELASMASIIDPQILTRDLSRAAELEEAGKLREEVVALGQKISHHLSLVTKLNLLRDLTVISFADGFVDRSEVMILYGLCEVLGIKSEFIDDVLAAARSGPD